RPGLRDDRANVEEQVAELVAAEILFEVFPEFGVCRSFILRDRSDHLRLEYVGRCQRKTARVHHAEDPVGALEIRGAHYDEERSGSHHDEELLPISLVKLRE